MNSSSNLPCSAIMKYIYMTHYLGVSDSLENLHIYNGKRLSYLNRKKGASKKQIIVRKQEPG